MSQRSSQNFRFFDQRRLGHRRLSSGMIFIQSIWRFYVNFLVLRCQKTRTARFCFISGFVDRTWRIQSNIVEFKLQLNVFHCWVEFLTHSSPTFLHIFNQLFPWKNTFVWAYIFSSFSLYLLWFQAKGRKKTVVCGARTHISAEINWCGFGASIRRDGLQCALSWIFYLIFKCFNNGSNVLIYETLVRLVFGDRIWFFRCETAPITDFLHKINISNFLVQIFILSNLVYAIRRISSEGFWHLISGLCFRTGGSKFFKLRFVCGLWFLRSQGSESKISLGFLPISQTLFAHNWVARLHTNITSSAVHSNRWCISCRPGIVSFDSPSCSAEISSNKFLFGRFDGTFWFEEEFWKIQPLINISLMGLFLCHSSSTTLSAFFHTRSFQWKGLIKWSLICL